jgi:hypothetical protein
LLSSLHVAIAGDRKSQHSALKRANLDEMEHCVELPMRLRHYSGLHKGLNKRQIARQFMNALALEVRIALSQQGHQLRQL